MLRYNGERYNSYTVYSNCFLMVGLLQKQVSERIVYQYHYTEWPDHGVPEFTLPVLKFIQKSASDNPPAAGPIIIHCRYAQLSCPLPPWCGGRHCCHAPYHHG